MKLGKNITPWGKMCKAQMVLLDMSLADVAKKAGYSRSYVSAVINGRVVVPEESRQKIGAVLKVGDSQSVT